MMASQVLWILISLVTDKIEQKTKGLSLHSTEVNYSIGAIHNIAQWSSSKIAAKMA